MRKLILIWQGMNIKGGKFVRFLRLREEAYLTNILNQLHYKLNIAYNFLFKFVCLMGIGLGQTKTYREEMQMYQFNKEAFDQAMIVAAGWNFELAIKKILEIKQGEWSLTRTQKAVDKYKQYMAVTKALGGIQLVPDGDIDEIWHMHILDTRAYMKDCEELFGEYLHHYPYFGMLGEENERQWLSVQSESESLWRRLFDEELYGADSVAQKCPQVCPCHIDQAGTVDARFDSLKLTA